METLAFYISAAVLVVSAIAVVVARTPLRGSLYLIVALTALALLFVLLDAPFVATMQLLVYAGAIMVLFVFVIMLLNLQAGVRPPYLAMSKIFGVLSLVYLGYRLLHDGVVSGSGKVVDGSVRAIGRLLVTDYLFAFEAISLLLLVAVVGAVVLGLKRLA